MNMNINNYINTPFAISISLSIDGEFDENKLTVNLLIDEMVNNFKYMYGNMQAIYEKYINPLIIHLHGKKNLELSDYQCNRLLTCAYGSVYIYAYAQLGKKFSGTATTAIVNSYVSIKLHEFVDVLTILDAILLKYPDSLTICDDTLIQTSEKNNMKLINNAINNKLKIPQKCMDSVIRTKNIDLCKLMLLSGCKLTDELFLIACKTADLEFMDFFLKNGIEPTSDGLYVLFDLYTTYKSDYNKFQRTQTEKNKKNIHMCVTLFRKYDYKITNNDLVYSVKSMIELENFKSLNLELDDAFMKACVTYDFYPSYHSEGKCNLECFKYLCTKPTYKMIVYYVEHGVKPTYECLNILCKHNATFEILTYIIETCGIMPDIKCLEEYVMGLKIQPLTLLFKKFNENTDKNNIIQKVDQSDDFKDDSIHSDTENNTNESESSSSSEQSDDPQIIVKKTIPKKSQPVVKSDTETESSFSNDDSKIFLKDIPRDYNFRTKTKINDELSKLFKLKKGILCSFIDTRKHLLSYLSSQKLLNSNELKTNNVLNKICNFDANKVILLEDLDKFVFLCVNLTNNDTEDSNSSSSEDQKPKKVIQKKTVGKVSKKIIKI